MALLSVFIVCKLNIEGKILGQPLNFPEQSQQLLDNSRFTRTTHEIPGTSGPVRNPQCVINELPNTARNGVTGANRQCYDLKR